MTNLLYNERNIIGRLYRYFYIYFKSFSTPTIETLFLLVLSMLAMESANSVRYLYRHFLSGITEKSLNAFYYACSYAKADYCMWKKKESKLALAADMVRRTMPALKQKRSVIILCDSWYVKKNLVCVVEEYPNLDLIGNARSDSALYDLPPAPTGKRGRPAKRGRRLSIEEDFELSAEKVDGFYIAARGVLTNIFGPRQVMAYVTATKKKDGSRRLFFSTVFPEQLSMFCAWQEKAPLNQTGSHWMEYIPFFCYSFRWNIEISYYEQKTFWSLCRYMLRSRKGIEMLVNLINISYCAMKLLPYQDKEFFQYRDMSVQEFRLMLSGKIRQQVFYAHFVKNIESYIKSNAVMKALKSLVKQQGYHL